MSPLYYFSFPGLGLGGLLMVSGSQVGLGLMRFGVLFCLFRAFVSGFWGCFASVWAVVFHFGLVSLSVCVLYVFVMCSLVSSFVLVCFLLVLGLV